MKILFSSYRIDQYSDPEGFKLNIGLVLEQYGEDTIRFVTDPRTGVQRKHDWPPTVKNVVDACDQHVHEKARAHRFKNWGKGNDPMIEGPQAPRPTLDEMHEKYGKDWGLGRDEARIKTMEPAPSWDSIIAHYQADPSLIARLTGPLMTRNVK
jgi:hypothetical protein